MADAKPKPRTRKAKEPEPKPMLKRPGLTPKNVGLLIITGGLLVCGISGGALAMIGACVAILGWVVITEAVHGPVYFKRGNQA